jgi:hypothetical protein
MLHRLDDMPMRAGNDEGVRTADLETLVGDCLALRGYALVRSQAKQRENQNPSVFRDNGSFWAASPSFHEGQRIALHGFLLTEWIPAAPGRYFTSDAIRQRAEARTFYSGTEYLPLGKLGMVLGGVGSVRFASKLLDVGRQHFLGATQSGVCDEGVPVCVEPTMYQDVIPLIKAHGSCECDIVAKAMFLPRGFQGIRYEPGIPRQVLLAEDIRVAQRAPLTPVRAAAAIAFEGACRDYEREYRSGNRCGWSFAYFDPRSNSPEPLSEAVEWLQEYVCRHSVVSGATILADFDEQMDHFSLPLEMRLSAILSGSLGLDRLEAFTTRHGLTINIAEVHAAQASIQSAHIHEYHEGDSFEHVQDSTIINRSNK